MTFSPKRFVFGPACRIIDYGYCAQDMKGIGQTSACRPSENDLLCLARLSRHGSHTAKASKRLEVSATYKIPGLTNQRREHYIPHAGDGLENLDIGWSPSLDPES